MRVLTTFLSRISRRGFRNFVSAVLAMSLTVLAGLSNAQVSFAADNFGVCGFTGDGSPGAPFEIGSEQNLQCLYEELDYTIQGFSFIQTNNIVLTSVWSSGIGAGSYPFNGTYDGNGFTISGLNIHDSSGSDHDKVGFFDALDSAAAITRVNLVSPRFAFQNTAVSSSEVGFLAGAASCATISHSSVSTGLMIISSWNIANSGGFVGTSCGNLHHNSLVDTEVSITLYATDGNGGAYNIGGFVGLTYVDTTATPNIFAQTNDNTVSGSILEVDSVDDAANIGGFVGSLLSSSMSGNSVEINVNVFTNTGQVFALGGFVGFADREPQIVTPRPTISSSSYSGNVYTQSGRGGVYGVGGFAGKSWGATFTNDHSVGLVSANNLGWEIVGVGGLIGLSGDQDCANSSECQLRGSEINGSSHSGNVDVSNESYSHAVGGLIGAAHSSAISSSKSSGGTVSQRSPMGQLTSSIGGLVGMATQSTLTKVSSTMNVWGDSRLTDPDASNTAQFAGGLVGRLELGSIDIASYAGNVTGISSVGGIAGLNDSSSVSNVSVNGVMTADFPGGLFGNLSTNSLADEDQFSISKAIFIGTVITSDQEPGRLIANSSRVTPVLLPIMEFVYFSEEVDGAGIDLDPGIWQSQEIHELPNALLKFEEIYPRAPGTAGGFDMYSGYQTSQVNGSFQTWGVCDAVSYPFLRDLTSTNPCGGTFPTVTLPALNAQENMTLSSPVLITPTVSGLSFAGSNGSGMFWVETRLQGCDALPAGLYVAGMNEWSSPGESPEPSLAGKPGFNTSGTHHICLLFQDDSGSVALSTFTLVIAPLVPGINLSRSTVQHGETLIVSDNLSANKTLAVFVDGVRSMWRASSNGTNLSFNWSQWGDGSVHTVVFRIYDTSYSGLGSGPSLSTAYAASQTATWASYVAPTPSPTPSANPSPSASPSASPSVSPTPSPTPAQPISRAISIAATPGALVAGSSVNYEMQNLLIGSAWNLTLRSTPQVLQSGQVGNSGGVTQVAVIPAGLEPGWHSLTFYGVDSSGSQVETVLWFRISASGLLLESTTSPTAAQLAQTGSRTGLYISAASVFLLLGVVLVMWRRKLVLVPEGGK